MKFIFPKNYNFKNKIFGIIDYSTALVNIIWYAFIFLLINLLFSNIKIKIFVFIFTCFPVLLFSISGLNGENFLFIKLSGGIYITHILDVLVIQL